MTLSKVKQKKNLEFFFMDDLNLDNFVTDSDGVSVMPRERGKKVQFMLLNEESFHKQQKKFQELQK